MSRSYKKTGAYRIAGGSDKWDRIRYNKDERRKVRKILKEQKKYGTEYFKPYKEECCLYGDVCQDDDYYIDDISSSYIHNACAEVYGKKEINTLRCSGCLYSTNQNHNDSIWESEPCEKIILNKADRELPSADKYNWASDGGAYWHADFSELRKEFDESVFSISNWNMRNAFRFKQKNIWEKYCAHRIAKHNKKHLTMQVSCYYNIDSVQYKWVKTFPYKKNHWFDKSVLPEGAYNISIYKCRGTGSIRNSKYDIADYAISLLLQTTF